MVLKEPRQLMVASTALLPRRHVTEVIVARVVLDEINERSSFEVGGTANWAPNSWLAGLVPIHGVHALAGSSERAISSGLASHGRVRCPTIGES